MIKRKLFVWTIGVVSAMSTFAQTATDAYQISQGDLKGTARFMSMGGAFTALGGDPSVLPQNPAGLGVYRNSEVNATMDINVQSVKTTGISTDQTKVTCPNISYIGAYNLGNGVMNYFNWGISYGRLTSFDAKYNGRIDGTNASLTNYVANYTAAEQWTPSQLNGYGNNDPFYDTRAPWMSILLYNAYAINPGTKDGTDYVGLYNGTPGMSTFDVEQKGYVDQYNISFGGNFSNVVYWGINFGITDIDYKNWTYYTETFEDATIANASATGRTNGLGQFGIESYKHISGTGFNFGAGVILRPIPQLRFGVSIKTPTYYNLDYNAYAQTNYNYEIRNAGNRRGYYPTNDTYGADDYFSFKCSTPLELNLGLATVLANRAIVSVDYEYKPYQNMNVKDDDGITYNDVKGDIKTYYKAQNIVRAGVEYRVTPQVSLRLGYAYESSPVTDVFKNCDTPVYTSGPDDTETQASYIVPKSTQYITCGLGWHYKSFYADAAYVHMARKADWHAFTSYQSDQNTWIDAPAAELTTHNNRIVLSVGFKF